MALTAAQLIAQALAPSYKQLDTARQQGVTALNQSNTNLANYLSGFAPQVQADYANAVNQQVGIANEGAAALRAANPNADVQKLLAAIGAPSSQQSAVASQLGNTFNSGGAALFGLQGYVPGNYLSQSGLAQLEFNRALPGLAQAHGQSVLGDFLTRSQQQRDALAAEGAKLLPSLTLQLQDQAAKNAALKLNQRIAAQEFGLKVQNTKFNQKATSVRLSQAQTRLKISALNSDRQWQATLRRLGLQEAGLKLRATQLEAKRRAGGFTPLQLSHFKATAADSARDAKAHGIGYRQLIKDLVQHGIPLRIAQRAANRYWPTPGIGGRPLYSVQQKKRIKKNSPTTIINPDTGLVGGAP